jgi:hypothetical protein
MARQAPTITDTGQGGVIRQASTVTNRQAITVGGVTQSRNAASNIVASQVSVSEPTVQRTIARPAATQAVIADQTSSVRVNRATVNNQVAQTITAPAQSTRNQTVRATQQSTVIADPVNAATATPQATSTLTVVTPSQDPALLSAITDGVTEYKVGETVYVTSVNNISYNQSIRNINNNPGGGINGEIQFYQGGQFSADPNFYYTPGTGTLTVKTGLTTGVVTSNTVTADNVTASTLAVTGGANLGSVNSLVITGGNSNQFLYTNGTGNLGWATISSNGNIIVDNTSLDNGTSNVIVNASSNVVFSINGQSNVMTVTDSGAIANLFTSNNYTLGNTTTTISTSRWMDAITTSTNPTVLFTASNAISSVDIHITAVGDGSKQISKMLSVTQDTTTNYSLYGNVVVGSDLAAFTMDQTGGNVRVIATSTTANRVDYRLVITLYS